MKNSKFFIDTNVLVYSAYDTDPLKQKLAQEWILFLVERSKLRVSTQILSEYFNVVTQKLTPALSIKLAKEDLVRMKLWEPSIITHTTLIEAIEIKTQYKTSWWDSIIIASAFDTGCSYLLSEDLSHGAKIGKVEVVNPFMSNFNDFN